MRRRGSFIVAVLVCICKGIVANDGSFRGSGSSLIPINDSSIFVQKEVLTFTRVNESYVVVDVYYEFFNQGKEKELVIGFEAKSPFGDVQNRPKNGEHPYISKFTVEVNNQKKDYEVAIVENETYLKNGITKALNPQQIDAQTDHDYVDFFYVYYFNSTLRSGVNIIKHSYVQEMSSSVMDDYSIDYVLTAANRWKGGVIDDFTLEVNMGKGQRFSISNSFFQDDKYWLAEGRGQVIKKDITKYDDADWTTFFIDSGTMIFKKLSFEPTGDFRLASFRTWAFPLKFDARSWSLPANFNIGRLYPEPVDDFSKKIMRNYPFALRGYVFKNKDLLEYYNKQAWYKSDVSYEGKLDSLSELELEWVLRF